ncbi:lipocalin family protein [Pseudomonas capsici]|uniref:Outer membrane lipoprotein Blc n=1 Tax=Pseudomonas capsici TaxID=2810614 RepID=A0ABT3C3V7_9PSED|nr:MULTISPECIES: lipocalin family protein [Pseudomonas]MBN6717110.1 lipocalin family protein [Pseudomonas capsici]MBN6722202.1 lipocalin family protein [Pseudomonas capsici]MBN6727100.1 lipocalin family protein [Pseudomonas capsici]MBX8478040.1 lipocalin family protein [Pseudomonas cichorii]MBX8610219.1 lipocalin family protein [Pseudomonas cichorii]
MIKLLLRFGILVMASFLAIGFAHSEDNLEPKTVDSVDLNRYQGTWYELARLPMFFQRNCAQSEAHYTLKPDGNIGVTNRCRTAEGKWQEATGTASPQVAGKTDKLWVVFDNWFSRLLPGLAKGDYWVLYISDDYKTAVVGNPDRKYLWLLSRTPTVPEWVKQEMLSKARQQGYDTSRLIWREDDSKIGK